MTPDELREQMKHAVVYTSDVAPVVHGYWIFEEYPDGYYHWECSNCMGQFSDGIVDNADEEWKYCPKCGAKMSGGTSDGGVFIVEQKRIGVDIHEQELVMCKHCKHATMISAGVVLCDRYNHVYADDWFCADGERMEEHG